MSISQPVNTFSPKDVGKKAVITPFGLFAFLAVAIGLRYAGNPFPKCIANLLQNRFVSICFAKLLQNRLLLN